MNESNPYQSPQTPVTSLPAPQSALRIKAVVLGWLIDIGTSVVLGFGLGVVFGIGAAASGTRPENIQKVIEQNSAFHWAGVVLGLFCSAWGGYCGAWIAGRAEIKHGLAVGVVSLVFGLLMLLALPSNQPIHLTVISILCVVPISAAGGWLRKRQVQT